MSKENKNVNKDIYFVILCGGSGTRLWPLSRKYRPKQLLPFIDNKSLLEQTIDRVASIAQSKKNILLVTTEDQAKLISKKIIDKVGKIIKEPAQRNTGPAILYSALKIESKYNNCTVVVLPADHYIPDTKTYCSYLQKAINNSQKKETIVTMGLMPTYPATGYGYIQAIINNNKLTAGRDYKVKKFHEKPNIEKAKEYFVQKEMFWNLGMFISKISVLIDEYKNLSPEIYNKISNKYEDTPNISIDYAIMEKSNKISVIPCDFEWNDVGNLETYLSIQQKHNKNNTNKSCNIININSKNNIVHVHANKKIVSFVGIDNICVIEDDDVILIAKRNEIERVKEVQKKL